MMDNTKNRLHDIFFYGLYIDPKILRERGVTPRNPKAGYVENYELQIGRNSALLRSPGKTAYGMMYQLTHAEIHALYPGCGLTQYAAESVLVCLKDRDAPALCYNLIDIPTEIEPNRAYEEALLEVKKNLALPVE